MNEQDSKYNWERTRAENLQMDPDTEQRLDAAISRKISAIKNRRKTYWAVAATVLIGVGISFYTLSPDEVPKTQTSFYYASKNDCQVVNLPDGSTVVLEPQSDLVIAEDFGISDRKITFTGKGTFDIAKDKSKPFRINAKDFEVQVLGTQFFLDQTAGNQKVNLYAGKVKINQGGNITYLLPKESWARERVVETEPLLNPVNDSRTFSFQDETFDQIIAKLEIEYDINIDYPQEYRNRRMVGSMTGNLDEIIATLCYPFNLKSSKINEKQIELK